MTQGGGGATNFRIGCLRVLERVITGAQPSKLLHVICRVIEALAEHEMLHHENYTILLEISKSIFAIASKCEINNPSLADINYKLFSILAYLQSVPENEKMSDFVMLQTTVGL